MKKYKVIKFINLTLVVVVCIAFIANLYYSDQVSVAGYDLSEIENDILMEQKAFEDLNNAYLQQTSIAEISKRSLENGYVANDFEFFSSPKFASR